MSYFISFENDLRAGKTAPVYLLYGKESFLKRRAVDKFKEILLEGDSSEFNLATLDGTEISMGEVVALARTYPLLAAKRLVVVYDPPIFATTKKGVKGLPEEEKKLLDYLARPAPFSYLVFVMDGNPDKRKKTYRELNKTGIAIDFAPLGHNDILTWLAYECRAAGKRLDVKAGNELVARVGTSLNILENELGKVINFVGEKEKITIKEIHDVVSGGLESNIFDMVDALGEGKYAETLKRIKDLLLNKEPPQVILALLARQFRLILALTKPGADKRLKLHPYVAQKIKRQGKNFDQKISKYALQKLLEIDLAVKSGKQDFYPAIETMILQIAMLNQGK